MTIDYNLTEKEQKAVRHIAHQVRIASENLRLERLKGNKRAILLAAYDILAEMREVECTKALLAASKRIGDKLK